MRRKEKEIKSRAEIDEVIAGCQVCRLAFAVHGEAYLVPLSFGYDGSALYAPLMPDPERPVFFRRQVPVR